MEDFLKLYEDISNQLYRYILKMSKDTYLTEEIVQETFYRAMEHMIVSKKELRPSWFFTVARNLYFDYTRNQKKFLNNDKLENNEESILGIPEKELEQKLITDDIRNVLNQMNDTYRKILILREFKELSYSAIASKMKMSTPQVKITLFRARNKFKKLYERGNK